MLTTVGHILAAMFATIATLFAGHVVGDATPPPPYITVPGSLLTVPSNFGNRQSAQVQGETQSMLTASAVASQEPHAQSAPPPKTPAPVATTSDAKPAAKPAAPLGILCHGTFYDACPADTVFQCAETGRVCRTISVPAQVLWTTPKKSDCQIEKDQVAAQIALLQQNANQNTDAGGTGTSSSEDDRASKIAALQSRLQTLQTSCNS